MTAFKYVRTGLSTNNQHLPLFGSLAHGSFTPLSLFGAGEQGAWLDVEDMAHLWTDTAGTVAAALGSAIARIDDKSGNNNNFLQATGANRPVLKTYRGCNCLDFDGVNDVLSASFAFGQPITRIVAIQQISNVTAQWMFGGYATGNLMCGMVQTFPNVDPPQISLYAGSHACPNGYLNVGDVGVVTAIFNGASSKLAVNAGAYVTGNPGAGSPAGLAIGASNSVDGANTKIRLFGLVTINRVLTPTEIANTRTYLAAAAGFSL